MPTFPTPTPKITELSPNAEMTPAQEEFPKKEQPVVVNALTQRFASLDMSPTPEEAYEAAVFNAANEESTSTSALVPATRPPAVSVDHQQEFLRLLSRFHQAVAPLPKSITSSFRDDQQASSSTVSVRSKLTYCPARSYARPQPARRRTESAPGRVSSLLRANVVFNDMESLVMKAEEMVDVMRNDMEETMRRGRVKDREARDSAMSVDGEEDAPLVRKVPVAVRPAWYAPSGNTSSAVQDSSMAISQHRPIITPRRLRSTLTTIPEVTEPGEPLAPDAIDKCASKMMTLRIEDTRATAVTANPIRLYVGYNRVQRPPFVWGSDMISTPNCTLEAM